MADLRGVPSLLLTESELRARVLSGNAPEDAPSTWRIRVAEAAPEELEALADQVAAIPDRTLRTYAQRELEQRRIVRGLPLFVEAP